MWFLYLDESGDMGFDFKNKKPSKFFVITILSVRGLAQKKKLEKAVQRTRKHKVNYSKKSYCELKGSHSTFGLKKYLIKHMNFEYEIYSVILDKRNILKDGSYRKVDIYTFAISKLLELTPIEKFIPNCYIFIDKSKNRKEIEDLNKYLYHLLEEKIAIFSSIKITHAKSEVIAGLQAVDLFCYGISRKYELNDTKWYSMFSDKIIIEKLL